MSGLYYLIQILSCSILRNEQGKNYTHSPLPRRLESFSLTIDKNVRKTWERIGLSLLQRLSLQTYEIFKF